MERRFSSQVILVTGGTTGIGLAAAERLVVEGATIVLASRDKDRGEEVARRIRTDGGQALFVSTDVTIEEDVAAAIRAATDNFGRLDGAFNNAGGGENFGSIRTMETSLWQRMIDLNLTSVYYSMKYEIPAIMAAGGGAILNNASVGGVLGSEAMQAYAAAKHGVVGLTRSTALEMSKHGVRINAVVPGVIRTPMYETAVVHDPEFVTRLNARIPLGRVGEVSEIAAFVAFLLSEEAAYISGSALAIDGAISSGLLA
jgi:NAD(P)-dependent dehydrogenase (short-subunit alcohol dehydrogenase family)